MRSLIDLVTDYLSLKLGQHKVKLGKEFIKFCLVGVTNLTLYFSIYVTLTRLAHWHYIPAAIVGNVIAVTWSFVVNRYWTFKNKQGNQRAQYVKFIISNVICVGISLTLLTILIEVFRIYDIYAQMICTVLVAFINFSLNRFWTFRNH